MRHSINMTGLKRAFQILIFGLVSASASFAQAQSDDSSGPSEAFFQGIELQVGTEFPVQFGARARVLLPADFYLLGGVGMMPQFYSDGVAALGSGIGVFNSGTSKAVGQALKNSFYFDLRAGYKIPTTNRFFDGFFIDLGYSLMVGGGGNVTSLNDVYQLTGNIYTFNAFTNVDVKSVVHNVTAHAGYTFSATRRMLFTVEVGLVKPLGVVNMISVNQMTNPVETNTLRNDFDSSLSSAIRNQLIIPTGGIWASFLF